MAGYLLTTGRQALSSAGAAASASSDFRHFRGPDSHLSVLWHWFVIEYKRANCQYALIAGPPGSTVVACTHRQLADVLRPLGHYFMHGPLVSFKDCLLNSVQLIQHHTITTVHRGSRGFLMDCKSHTQIGRESRPKAKVMMSNRKKKRYTKR
ncbi:hypothetical protein CPB86DRAFT_361683 [Serendipita vermifera]|nr:hypothetical protein CPB86DRAFT_361683 [Serendipita vermifera]